MRIAAAGATSVGRVRELNEDAFLVDDRLTLYAVADGMGGHQGGEVASATAIEALRAAVASGRAINEAISTANAAVLEKATGAPDLEGMGTTLTAVVAPAASDTLLIGHVGDSRAYLLRDDRLERLTEDHSLVEELVREGRLTPEQAEVHPQRAIITRALGVDADVDVDVYTTRVRAGDRVLLCSDGLTTMVRDRDVARIGRSERDARVVAEALVDAANDAGGEDNVTVVVIDVLEVETPAAPDPELLVQPPAPVTPTPLPAPDAPAPLPVDLVHRVPRRRRIVAASLVVVPLLAVLAVAVGGVAWYARQSYYVGFDRGEVVLYRGIPGGVLGFDPTVEERTGIRRSTLLPADERDVDDGAARGSRERAERYLAGLLERSTTTTTRPTTTTTTRRTSSTTRPATTATSRP